MSSFDKICDMFEQKHIEKNQLEIKEKADAVISQINSLCDFDGKKLICDIIVACAVADGSLKEVEYDVICPSIQQVLGEKFDKDALRNTIVAAMKDFKSFSDSLDVKVDALGEASQELKDDIILICMAICACDGKISYKEAKWLKKLAD